MHSDNGTAILSDETDLLELFKAIWQQRWLVASITLFVTLLAAIYAFVSTPLYEAKYYVSPPTLENIANLNYGRTRDSGLNAFSVDDIYKIFLRNLQSESLRRSFFEENYPAPLNQSVSEYETFSKLVMISPFDKEPYGRWLVSMQGVDPETITKWVSLYVDQAGKSAQREVINNATKEASVLARNLQLQIDSLRESAKNIRQDNISQLREALAVAKASGLEHSVVFTGEGSSELVGDMAGHSAYMRGSKVLEAELKNLESRDSNDPFIPQLRNLQNKYDFYKGLESAEYTVAVFRQDGNVDQPIRPIKPKKILILMFGFIVGGLLGTVVALGRNFILRRRQDDLMGKARS